MRLKVHRRQGDVLVAACDSDLVDSGIWEGGPFEVTSDFYGEETDEERVREALGEATIVNVLGTEAVSCAVEEGLVEEGRVGEVRGVPHAQMVVIF